MLRPCLAWSFAVALVTPPAHALEGQWRLGVSGGVVASTAPKVGPVGNLYAGYGVFDALDLRLEVGAGRFVDQSRLRTGLSVGGSALVKFDVTHWVPYVALGANYVNLGFAGDGATAGVLLLPAAGVDYLLSREHALGLEYRFALPVVGGYDTAHHQVLAHWEQRWGW